ncbi:(E3-independent) E2 ubiquitin-conjugating enzyme-like isoform X2 [Oppia nitens]|uniref:(E3-independent) E2 ubiquitin-conjugating enzyme-like isoform X2 n=1 Tax=Oppia nitens TaxID=1686743 RepID=UPI0023DC25A2|nr:(E3-independent) E2 ubiquitin-conjugating enzyme-like isoform X2 [Oppia nitens]
MLKRETLCEYFDEDVVVKRSSNGGLVFALVIESSENASDDEDSDVDSDSHYGSSSMDNKWQQLKPGFAKVAVYPNGNTLVINETKTKLYDRSLLNGDVVQRLDPNTHKIVPNGEHGFCQSSKIWTTVKILGTNKVIENVDSNELQMLSGITTDSLCLLDSWIGYVKEIYRKITLKCCDGSLLVVDDLDISEFTDLLTQRDNDDSEFNREEYYIGQQLLGPKSHLKNAKWISQTLHMKRFMRSKSNRNSKITFVVEDIVIDSVSINWFCCLSDESFSVNNKLQNCDIINSPKNTLRNNNNNNNNNKLLNSPLNVTSHPNGDNIRGDAISRIKCLNYFRKSSLQIGHQCYYTVKENDSLIPFNEWEENESKRLFTEEANREKQLSVESDSCIQSDEESNCETNKDIDKNKLNDSLSMASLDSIDSRHRKYKKPKTHISVSLKSVKKKKIVSSNRKTTYLLPIDAKAGSRLPVEIVATNTRVSVVWQNSEIEHNVPSVTLYPVHHIDNHDFFPGDFVVENKDILQSFEYGVIQKCDYTSRTAIVKWFSLTPDSLIPQLVTQQELSVYDIKDHPDFNFRSGVCVVRILHLHEEDCDSISRTGQVLDLTLDGMLRCVWLNGKISLVSPQQLFVIGDYDSDDLWAESDSDLNYSDYSHYESAESWETDEEKTASVKRLQKGVKQVEEWLQSGTGYRNGVQNLLKVMKRAESSLEKIRQNITEKTNNTTNDSSEKQLSNYGTRILQLSRRLLDLLPFSGTVEPNGINNNIDNTIKEINDTNDEQCSSSGSDPNIDEFLKLIDNLKTQILENDIKSETINDENLEEKSLNCCNCDELIYTQSPDKVNSNEIKENVIFLEKVPENHKFIYSPNSMNNPKDFLKRIKYEISLLKSSLPEGISVATFHDRMDLLSVMIYGPNETPYEDGLFLFDIQLPANYPNVPPLVHYISYCSDRLNPNLYENGKVCVSLLGTWSGKGTEVWSPITSNLLQVIVSIQGLILVAEPYYNEAGYQKQKGTTMANENSRLYNEMVVIKMIQSMTKMLSLPHEAFERQMRDHIQKISDKFIERVKNWEKVSQMCISESITTLDELVLSESMKNLIQVLPPFPLLPASHGFCLSLNKAIVNFEETLGLFLKF